MNLENLWNEFKNSKLKKDLFIRYCIENITENELKNISIQQASRNICAACMNISEEEISMIKNFDEIENIACDLEVPDDYRDRSIGDWEKLKTLMKQQ